MAFVLGALYMLVIGAAIVSMSVLLLKGKKETYNKMYLGCQSMVILWCASQIFILLSETGRQMRFSYVLGNIGVCFVGAFWLAFAFLYGERTYSKGVQRLPFILSGMHYLMFLTNDMHHLYYTHFSLGNVEHGILFYTNVAETYLFVVIGAVLLYQTIAHEGREGLQIAVKRRMRSNAAAYKAESTEVDATRAKALVIVAVLVPVLFNMFYMTGVVRASFDITPLGFGISNILVLIATFKFRFMEIHVAAFDVVLSGLSDGVGIFSENGKCTFSNAMFQRLLVADGRMKDKFSSGMLLTTNDIRKRIAAFDSQEEHVFVDENGNYLQIQIYQKGLAESDGLQETTYAQMNAQATTVFVIKDISRYYELLRQTRELAVTNERLALERERNRIAQQVHDTAGHTLTMIQSYMKLAAVANQKQEPDKVKEYLEDARTLTGEGIKELRQSINQLRKEAESELVTQGILQLANQVKEIPVELTVQGEDGKEYSHLSRVLYECVRESITNTLKYANATKIEIILRFKTSYVELMVADNGAGCETIVENNGISGIRKKVEQADGKARFITGTGEGFLTRIRIPVKEGKTNG